MRRNKTQSGSGAWFCGTHVLDGLRLRRVRYFILKIEKQDDSAESNTHDCHESTVNGSYLQEMHLFLLTEVQHVVQVDLRVVVVSVAILKQEQ